jgi:hypothetical protein
LWTNRYRVNALLREIYGTDNVIASDIRKLNNDVVNSGPFEVINALDFNQIEHLVEVHKITDVFDGRFTISNCREKSRFCLGLEYEFVVSRFEFGESRKDQKIFGHLVLPFLDLPP